MTSIVLSINGTDLAHGITISTSNVATDCGALPVDGVCTDVLPVGFKFRA